MIEEGRAITKDEAKDKIRRLANSFSNTPLESLSKKTEDDIKFQFIEPLFEALGWKKEDIEKEKRVLKGRADYILKLGNQEVMVIEAKKTSVSLDDEEGRQAVSYAYHRKIKFAVLTNFKQIKVYHALSNIKNINKNLLRDDKGYLVLNSYEFEKEFERLLLLSRESFEKGAINKLLSAKDERLSKPIDESILEDLLQYRDWLSKDLKKLRMHLSDDSIDEIVQILIDRLIFMRSVEDRGLEDKDLLLNIVKDFQQGRTEKRLWELLKMQFAAFDKTYNSKLFAEGLLEKEGFFDEDTLKKVINGLYFGTKDNRERYMFDEIPGDLLGNIYEQYLGTVLRGSDKRVKLEEGTGKRKKMGIYYTPSYIVDYIVKNTVGEYIRNKTIDEILDTRIVDPACGSGSFLIRAFREVCDVAEKKLEKGERSLKWQVFKNYKGRLNLGQKMEILRNCIYGVDLDEKAVELAQLNLLLRLLEDETKDTRKQLPTLKENIKCGNSLIDDLSISDKAFSWRAQFQKVFAQGGFDVVVGNPPYGAELPEKDREYLDKKFNLGNTDTACLFMSFATDILKKDGVNGFIIPKPFVYSSTWKKIREKLLDGLIEIVDCSKVWKEVKLEQVVYFFNKDKKEKSYRSCVRDNQEIKCIGNINKETFNEFGFLLNGISEKELKIGRKIKDAGTSLNEFVTNQRGAIYQKQITETQSDFKVLGGAQIGRYIIHPEIKGYISKTIVQDNKAFIKENSILVQRLVAHIENPIDHIKITASLTNGFKLSDYIIVDTINQLQNKSNLSSEFLIAIINSNLSNWYAYRFIFGKAIRTMQFDNPVTERLIIPKIDKQTHDKIASFVNQMLPLQKKYRDDKLTGHEKELLEQQIKQVDFEIDQEVYKIYGITDEEKRVIEVV